MSLRSPQPFVSVVIPVYNDTRALTQCLQKLSAQTYPQPNFEVIVVDNGSRQSLQPAIASAAANVRFAKETKTGSYAARNHGLKLARGEVMAFTDADCLPAADWIEKGVQALLQTENCGLVGGGIKRLLHARSSTVEIYDANYFLQQHSYVRDKHFASTANMFTFKKILDKVGHFNAAMKSSGDQELGKRILSAGFRQVYADEAAIVHPLMNSLWAIIKKTRRLAGGHYDWKKAEHESAQQFKKNFRDLVKPPWRNFLGMARKNGKLRSRKMRVAYFFIQLLAHYAYTLEYFRLRLGGSSRRA